jgi:hypothetical protein
VRRCSRWVAMGAKAVEPRRRVRKRRRCRSVVFMVLCGVKLDGELEKAGHSSGLNPRQTAVKKSVVVVSDQRWMGLTHIVAKLTPHLNG